MFIRNAWYIGAWSPEITSKPRRRLIMNEPIVMFRCADGKVAALEDRCSHRRYPLSKGTMTNDIIQCGYHGLKFNRHGTCVHADGQDRPPPRSDIKAYPLEERHGLIWLWMGDTKKADPALMPDVSWLEQPGWTSWTGGYLHLKARDQLLTENLLDISHVSYVHKATIGSALNFTNGAEMNVTVADSGIRRVTVFKDIPTPPLYRASGLLGDRSFHRRKYASWLLSELRGAQERRNTNVGK